MQERYHELMSINSMISQQKNEELRGRELEALVVARDEDVPKIVAGRSYREAPEVDGLVYIEGDDGSEIGDMMRVRVVDGFVDDVAAERIDEGEA